MKNPTTLLLSLVHPDGLPPVYAFYQTLNHFGFNSKIITFETPYQASENRNLTFDIGVVGKHNGSFLERLKQRNVFKARVNEEFLNTQPVIVFAFCEFSFLVALELKKKYGIKVFFNCLELIDVSYSRLLRSPLNTIRAFYVSKKLNKADWLSCPSSERSAWLAGRFSLEKLPHTVKNCPFLEPEKKIEKKQNTEVVKILHSGGLNHSRAVIELIEGFSLINDFNIELHITNFQASNPYCLRIQTLVNQLSCKARIILHGKISREKLSELQMQSHIGVNLMNLDLGFDARMIAPNKVGEYLENGLLVLGVNTPYFEFLKFTHLGALIESLEAEEIASKLKSLIKKVKDDERYGFEAFEFVKNSYNMIEELRFLFKQS